MGQENCWQVLDELIEQPSWGGRYILDLKDLGNDARWQGKKVGQSFELSKKSRLKNVQTGEEKAIADTLGPEMNLLIKLTQAKGNSFQVHLPEGEARGHWKPKPEAWFYLAPGLYTFGLKAGTSFEAYSQILRTLDDEMERLSQEVQSGRRTVDDARHQAKERIQVLDPYAYVNTVEANTDDVVDLTAGGIHHSWEEDDARFPNGNLVYEVQIDVPDDECSMRGFDKGKFKDDGGLRPTHVTDYLATIHKDDDHNDPARHIRKPSRVSDADGATVENIFDTPYFVTDRLTLAPGASHSLSLADSFRHVFVHDGTATADGQKLERGRSYILPQGEAANLTASDAKTVLLVTYLSRGNRQ